MIYVEKHKSAHNLQIMQMDGCQNHVGKAEEGRAAFQISTNFKGPFGPVFITF